MSTYKLSESGQNGEVTLTETGIDRVIRRVVGRDDRQFIPYKSISFVEHDRKRIGRDVVVLHLGTKTLEWKVQDAAERFVDEVNAAIVAGGHRAGGAAPAPQSFAPQSFAPPQPTYAAPPVAPPQPTYAAPPPQPTYVAPAPQPTYVAPAPPPPPPPAPAPAPAGAWHPDPTGRFEVRYHDGVRWTHHVATRGVQGSDPIA